MLNSNKRSNKHNSKHSNRLNHRAQAASSSLHLHNNKHKRLRLQSLHPQSAAVRLQHTLNNSSACLTFPAARRQAALTAQDLHITSMHTSARKSEDGRFLRKAPEHRSVSARLKSAICSSGVHAVILTTLQSILAADSILLLRNQDKVSKSAISVTSNLHLLFT